MPTYIYRSTNTRNVLIHGGKEYRSGDRITLPKAEAQSLALSSRRHRFEEVSGEGVIGLASIEADTAPLAPKTDAPASKS